MRNVLGLLVCAGLTACRKEPPPPPAASGAPVSVTAPVAMAPAASPPPASSGPTIGATPSASPSPSAPAPEIAAYRLDRPSIVVLLEGTGERATLVNEKLGEWLTVSVKREGDQTRLSGAFGVLELRLGTTEVHGSLTLGSGPKRPVTGKPWALSTAAPLPPEVRDLAGNALDPAAIAAARPMKIGTTTLGWKGAWLAGSPSLAVPAKASIGGVTIAPEPLSGAKEGRCSVFGVRAGASGQLDEALRAAQVAEARSACPSGDEEAVIEASYAVVRFAGVNEPEGPSKDPQDVVGLTFLHRTTSRRGSIVHEVGYLIGLAQSEVVPLRSLLRPTGARFLQERALSDQMYTPAGIATLTKPDRAAAVDLTTAALAAGPSTVDVIVPTEPFGLLLSSRRVRLGPRSELFPAFVKGPLTGRLVAMVFVDY